MTRATPAGELFVVAASLDALFTRPCMRRNGRLWRRCCSSERVYVRPCASNPPSATRENKPSSRNTDGVADQNCGDCLSSRMKAPHGASTTSFPPLNIARSEDRKGQDVYSGIFCIANFSCTCSCRPRRYIARSAGGKFKSHSNVRATVVLCCTSPLTQP